MTTSHTCGPTQQWFYGKLGSLAKGTLFAPNASLSILKADHVFRILGLCGGENGIGESGNLAGSTEGSSIQDVVERAICQASS